jgi:hypothetical protein
MVILCPKQGGGQVFFIVIYQYVVIFFKLCLRCERKNCGVLPTFCKINMAFYLYSCYGQLSEGLGLDF